MTITLNRREFLKTTSAVGGAFALEVSFPAAALAQAKGAAPAASEVTAWILIHPDDRVVMRVARSEMGQGSFTGLPMLIAEELECDWRKVSAEYAPVAEHVKRNRVWRGMGTGGSGSIRGSQEFLRQAGASAREMLIGAAAEGWKVPAGECVAENSVITHKPSGRRTTFGKVAAAAAKREVPKAVKLKDPKDWKLIGTAQKRFDIPDKVTGATVFGIDVDVPNMLHASVLQCPVFGGGIKSVDSAAAEKMRGVKKVINLGNAVVVVADNWWRANTALLAVKIEWDTAGNGAVSSDTIKAFLKAGLDDDKIANAKKVGDPAPLLTGAAKLIEAEYYAPFLNHATMEPQTCTAHVRGDQVEVWTSTQNGEAALAAAAEAAGVPLANVEVHKMHLGGGFGRRGAYHDFVTLAVKTAKQLDRPVKLTWSREEDMRQGRYRPVFMTRMKAALDPAGNLVAMHSKIAGQSILAKIRPEAIKDGIDSNAVGVFADMPYQVPNWQVDYAMRNTHVPVGFWRAVTHSQSPFFRECFLDEVAHAAGKDPYEFRRSLLKADDKNRLILESVAIAAGWESPLPKGVHRGIAVSDAYGSFAAAVIEVAVSAKGELDIKRVVVGVDCGYVVNTDSAKAQIESCVVYGLTAALYGENTIKDGRVVESNFHDYPMMRLREMPKVQALLFPSGGTWGGMGEPPLAPLAPALCNAIFAATGKRVRSLPLKHHDLKKA